MWGGGGGRTTAFNFRVCRVKQGNHIIFELSIQPYMHY